MTASASDIGIVLTGGSGNSNPNLSLGGDPSNIPITGILNNLFDNVGSDEALAGCTDYRCVYIFNNSSVDSFYNVRFYTIPGENLQSSIQFGLSNSTESQKITISGPVTGGSFDVSFTPPAQEEEIVTVDYNTDPATWGLNLENAINNITTLSGSTVTVAGTFSDRVFYITFSDFRNHDLLGLDSNGLTGGTITGSVARTNAGSPINSIPPQLDVDTTPPSGVSFYTTSNVEMLNVGTIYPEEGFPLWIKRTVAAESSAVVEEGFSLRIVFNTVTS